MTAPSSDEERLAALDAYLAGRQQEGYLVETRSDRQAVIRRRILSISFFTG
jgi:hypothetical protein